MEALLIGNKIFTYVPFIYQEGSNEPIAAVEIFQPANVEQESGETLLAGNFFRPRENQSEYILHIHELNRFKISASEFCSIVQNIIILYAGLTPLVIYEGLTKVGVYKPYKSVNKPNCTYGRLILKPRGSKEIYRSKFEIE